MDDVITRIGMHIFGRGHQVLSANPMSQFFAISFLLETRL